MTECNILTKNFVETKLNYFYKIEYRNKINIFSHNKLKFQPRS